MTQDEEVSVKVKEEKRNRGGNIEEVVNEKQGLGLKTRRELSKAKPFKVGARSLGKRVGLE